MSHIHDTIEQILSLGPARRGQLSEQFLKGRLKDGTEVRRGPYYVLQWYEGGEKKSARVPKEQVPRVREELARGRRAEAMLRDAEEALWKRLADPAQKKRRRLGRGTAGARNGRLPQERRLRPERLRGGRAGRGAADGAAIPVGLPQR